MFIFANIIEVMINKSNLLDNTADTGNHPLRFLSDFSLRGFLIVSASLFYRSHDYGIN